MDFSSLDTCDPVWQSTRDRLIISAHIFSEFALLVIVFTVDVMFMATKCSCELVNEYYNHCNDSEWRISSYKGHL